MSIYDDFVAAVLDDTSDIAKNILNGYESQALMVASSLLKNCDADLKRWTTQLAEKKITEEDFSDLIQAKKDVAEIDALTQKGIALTQVEHFKTELINLIVSKAGLMF